MMVTITATSTGTKISRAKYSSLGPLSAVTVVVVSFESDVTVSIKTYIYD